MSACKSRPRGRSFFVAALLLAGSALRATDGVLDTTYGASGTATVSLGASDLAYGGYLQSDGKMLVVGGARPVSSEDFGVARFAANGTLDTGFGSSGKYTLEITTSATDRATCVGVQSDGKIIVGGYTRNATTRDNFCVIRLTAAGALDTTFGTSGIVQIDFNGFSDRLFALKVLSNDKIVLAGWASDATNAQTDFAVVKLTAAGALDTTFGTGGKLTKDVGNSQDTGNDMAIDSGGSIVVSGISASSGQNFKYTLLRVTPSGAMDASFGTGGVVTGNFGGSTNDNFLGVALQPDDKIVAVGYTTGTNDAVVARFTTAGALDTSFNTTGYRIISIGSNTDKFYHALVQADGKIVAAGSYVNGSAFDSMLARFTSAGALDTTFGASGTTTISFGSNNDEIIALGQQSSGDFVVGMYSSTQSGSADADFGVAAFSGPAGNTAPTFVAAGAGSLGVNQNASATSIASLLNASDSDSGQTLTWSQSSAPSHGTLNFSGATASSGGSNIAPGGTITYTPTSGFSGSDSFVVQVSDGTATATRTINVTVSDVTAPTVASIVRLTPAAQTITDGTTSVTFRVTYSESVQNVTTAQFSVEAVNGSNITGAVASVSGTGTTRDVAVTLTGGAGEFRLKPVN